MSETLADADRFELVDAQHWNSIKSEYEDDETVTLDRWTNYGKDRLYINNLKTGDGWISLKDDDFGGDRWTKCKAEWDLEGDELTVKIGTSRRWTYIVTIKVHGDGFEPVVEPREVDFDDQEACVSESDQEIVTDGGEDKTSHIEDGEIEAAIESNDDTDHPDALTVAEVRDALAEIQASFEGFWAEHMDSIEDGHLEVVAETEHVVVFADHTGHGWNEELDALGLDPDRSSNDRTIRITLAETHHRAASRLCDRNWSTADPFVVAKPDGVRNGQLFVETIINSLLQRGLSPGQAWAYYGVEIRGNSRNSWAKRCGYSDHSAVSEAVRKAKKKLPKE